MTQYTKQAEDFLKRFNLSLKVHYLRHDINTTWEDNKYRGLYQFTLKRPGATRSTAGNANRNIFTGKFWQSIIHEKEWPTAYDILACLATDIYCPDNFKDFCADYGYDEDSRNAEKMFKICDKFGRRLRAFFTKEEQEELIKIN